MDVYFLDTSGLVKIYVVETGTARMRELVRATGDRRFAILSISLVEFRSAVGRRERTRDLSVQSAADAIRNFEGDLESRMFSVQPTTESVLGLASIMVVRYPLRALDAIQLAGCLTLRATSSPSPVFVCADQRLLQAATLERLTCIDPIV